MVHGMTIQRDDCTALAELLPELERIGRGLCDALLAGRRDGFERIAWAVHERCPAWLPRRRPGPSEAIARALAGLRRLDPEPAVHLVPPFLAELAAANGHLPSLLD